MDCNDQLCMYVAALIVFERKVLRKIFAPVRVGDDFRIQYMLYELLNDMDVVLRIKIQRLREEDDLVSVGRTKSRKPCHRLM